MEVTVRGPGMEPRTQGHLEGPLPREKAQAVGKRQAPGNKGQLCPTFPGPRGQGKTPSHPPGHIMDGAREIPRHLA